MKTYTGTLFIDEIVYDEDGYVMIESTCKGAGAEEPFHLEAENDADAIEQARVLARDKLEYQEVLTIDQGDDYCPKTVAGDPRARCWVNEITATLDVDEGYDIEFRGPRYTIHAVLDEAEEGEE